MTDEEYIDSLTLDDLKAIATGFLPWTRAGQCPIDYEPKYPCRYSRDPEYNPKTAYYECPYSQSRCWVGLYVWRGRQSKKPLKQEERNG